MHFQIVGHGIIASVAFLMRNWQRTKKRKSIIFNCHPEKLIEILEEGFSCTICD